MWAAEEGGDLVEVRMTTLISGYGGLLTVLMSIKWRAAGSKLLTTSSCRPTSRRKWYSKAQPKEVQMMLIHKDRGQTKKTFNYVFYQDSNLISYCKEINGKDYLNSPKGLPCLVAFLPNGVLYV